MILDPPPDPDPDPDPDPPRVARGWPSTARSDPGHNQYQKQKEESLVID